MLHDYSTPLCHPKCAADHAHVTRADAVEMIVRPHNRFNAANAGDRVKIDRSELRVPSVRECLWTDAEAKAAKDAAREAAKDAAKPPVNPIGDAIRAQLEAAWKQGRTAPKHAPR